MVTVKQKRPVLAVAADALMLIGTLPASAGSDAAVLHAITIRHRHAKTAFAANPYDPRPAAAPLVLPIDTTGLFFQTPFFEVSSLNHPAAIVRIPHYRGPDGSYDDLGDLSSDIQGTPCGRDCTSRSLARWGYLPAQ